MTSRELFDQAIEVVLAHEGGYSDNPLDFGGPTNFGISSRFNPGLEVELLTRDTAIEVYWERYWKGRNYDMLPEPVATKVFDLAVNLGSRVAVKCLQRAVMACGTLVAIDGLIGPQTAGAVAMLTTPETLLPALRSEAGGEYRICVAMDSTQVLFLDGWLARAYDA